jgi:DNA-binding GntR family transcriptional regulator
METLSQGPTLAEQAYGAILQAICDGRLAPGAPLRQQEIAESLNVSRNPVAQALLKLKYENFAREDRRGLAVALLDPHFFHAIYQFRSAVDPLAAELACKNVAPESIKEGNRILWASDRALATGSVPKLIEIDMAFHMLIYQLSGNYLIKETMELYWNHLRRGMREVLRHRDYQPNVCREHAAIFSAITSGNAAEAKRLSLEHVQAASTLIPSALSKLSEKGGA